MSKTFKSVAAAIRHLDRVCIDHPISLADLRAAVANGDRLVTSPGMSVSVSGVTLADRQEASALLRAYTAAKV